MQVSMMDAVVFESVGHAKVVKRPVPQIEHSDEVIIKVERASICGSDLHLLADPPGYPATPGVIIGHECVGTVVETGTDVTTVKAGDRVIFDPNIPCGKCYYCQKGMPNMCETLLLLGFAENGVFAQYTKCPERVIVPISKDVPVDQAALAEPMNCVYGAVKKIRLLAGESVVILGGGPIGQIYAMLLKANGAGKIFMSEVSEIRTEYALKIGVDEVFNPLTQNVAEEVRKRTNGLGADVIVDAVGVLLPDAIDCARKGGRIILFGQNFAKQQTLTQNEITRKNLTVMGSYIGDYTFRSVAQLLESNVIDPSLLVSKHYKLTDFQEALAAMRSGTEMKVLLHPWDDEGI